MRESRSEYAFTRPVVNTYLVRERDRRLLRELAMVVLVVVCLGGGLLAYTWMHLEVLDTGYRIVDLERRLRDLAQEERRLQLESAYLASPPRIEERAARELGMQGPVMEQVVFAEELRAGELPGPTASATSAAALALPAEVVH
jgi:cell division protein FtsL